MPELTKTIPVFEAIDVVVAPDPVGLGGRPLQARGGREFAIRIIEIGVEVLEANMAAFIGAVGGMIGKATDHAGVYHIESVEVQCQISGSGKIGFAGTGMDMGGNTSMKIVFKRKPS